MNLERQPLYESPRLDADVAEAPDSSKEFGGSSSKGLRELFDRREGGIAAPVLNGADVVGRQLRALRQLLEREPEGLASATNRLPEVHGREVGACIPRSTTIGGVAEATLSCCNRSLLEPGGRLKLVERMP